MRYVTTFRVNRDDSGKATYIASLCNGNSPPYQKYVENDRCEQEFIFSKITDLTRFIEKGFKEFPHNFEIMHIYTLEFTKSPLPNYDE